MTACLAWLTGVPGWKNTTMLLGIEGWPPELAVQAANAASLASTVARAACLAVRMTRSIAGILLRGRPTCWPPELVRCVNNWIWRQLGIVLMSSAGFGEGCM